MQSLTPKPLISSLGTGLVASLCCGGSLVFGSIGLGALYGAIGFSRYIPQALGAGALLIVAINYLFYVRAAKQAQLAQAGRIIALRQAMFVSSALGLAAMAVSFVFLEWLNHAVVNPHFLSRPAYGEALIPGVPNVRLVFALAVFSGLALLWALPWPPHGLMRREAQVPAILRQALRVGVLAATAALLLVLVMNAMSGGTAGHGPMRHSGAPHLGAGVAGSRQADS